MYCQTTCGLCVRQRLQKAGNRMCTHLDNKKMKMLTSLKTHCCKPALTGYWPLAESYLWVAVIPNGAIWKHKVKITVRYTFSMIHIKVEDAITSSLPRECICVCGAEIVSSWKFVLVFKFIQLVSKMYKYLRQILKVHGVILGMTVISCLYSTCLTSG